MQRLSKENPALVLDLLTARCVFEREGVKLYDAVIEKIERGPEPKYQVILEQLRQIRGEEKEHEEWLEGQIRALGGDPHARTSLSDLETEEAQGVKSVIVDGHQQVPHLLHALLAAEAADNAGWDLLVKLAIEAGDSEARREFARRFAEETKHLIFVRAALHRAVEIDILGSTKELPSRLPTALGRRAGALAKSVIAGLGMIALGRGLFRAARSRVTRAREA